MKKIIKTITIIITFFALSKTCIAIEIDQGDIIEGVKIHLKTSTNERDTFIYQMINKNTNELVYSITPNITFDNSSYEEYNYDGSMNKLDIDIRERIARIVYLGYGYQNRTDIKWYTITQYLIWEEVLKDNGEVYFIDNENNKINLYQEEIEEVLSEVNHFTDLPSFTKHNEYGTDYYIKLNEQLILEDTNNILEEFDIESSSIQLDYKVEDNKIIIAANNPTLETLYFTRKVDKFEKFMKIYISNSSQKYISRGNFPKYYGWITIYVNAPLVSIKNSSTNNLSLEGTTYNIYADDDSLYYQDIALNEEGLSTEYELWPGKYYLIETKSADGYEQNKEIIYFEVKKDDLILDLNSKAIIKNITIEKHLINDDGKETLAKDTKIYIYDKNNNLVVELTTDEFGKASTELTYGTYRIVNVKEEDLTIVVDENYDENETIIVKDNIIKEETTEDKKDDTDIDIKNNTGSLIIHKVDSITGRPLKGIKFGLYDQNKELIKEEVTNSEGKIIFKDLATGKYYIKEILNDNNLELDETAIEVEVKNNIDTNITSTNRTKIDVPNTNIYSYNLTIFISILIAIISLKMLKYAKVK